MAFILMSNHVHFVLRGGLDFSKRFIDSFKKLYSQYYSTKYFSKNLLRHNPVDFKSLRLGDESFEKAVAYVQMNSVAAKVTLNASDYPWGTGKVFFRMSPIKVTRIGDMYSRACIRLLRSKAVLPEDYLVDEQGVVHPSSYVPVKFVETVFRTPSRMNHFLYTSSKARQLGEGPTFSDQLLLSNLKALMLSLFRKENLSELSEIQKSDLLKQLRYRFSADPNQISRVTGFPYESVCRLLDTY